MDTLLNAESDFLTLPLSKRLKLETHKAHQRVDDAIMALSPFANLEGYKRFLAVQYRFQQRTAPLYARNDLNTLLPNLPLRCRFDAITQDCLDLGLTPDDIQSTDAPLADLPAAEAVGWLYVNEGSNLGAAFLLKYASQLGLTTQHGARHLAPSEDGRGLHWRQFTAQLDSLALSEAQKQQTLAGARNAFQFVEQLAQ